MYRYFFHYFASCLKLSNFRKKIQFAWRETLKDQARESWGGIYKSEKSHHNEVSDSRPGFALGTALTKAQGPQERQLVSFLPVVSPMTSRLRINI